MIRLFSFLIALSMITCSSPEYLNCDSVHAIRMNNQDPMDQQLALNDAYHSLIGLTAPNSIFIDLNNQSKKLYEEKGQVIMINFWFIGCKPCMAEMPFLMELKNEYEGKDVSFISIGRNSKEDLERYINKTQFNWPVYIQDDVKYEYCVNSYPTTVMLDKEMKVVHYGTGGALKEEAIIHQIDRFRSLIDTALLD